MNSIYIATVYLFQCDYLARQGIESLVITVMKDSHHLAGSEKGRSFLKEKHVFVKDFVLYCKGNEI